MLDWICQALNLPLLTENRAGFIACNRAAEAALQGQACPNLVTGLGALLGNEIDVLQVADAASTARQGQPVCIPGPQQERVLLLPHAPGLAHALIAPADLSDAGLRRRAAAADRSAAISHELANALGAIAGWAQLAQQGHQVDEALRLIEQSAQSAWASARQMLGEVSGKRGSTRPRPPTTDASAFVEEVARLVSPKALQHGVEVRTHTTAGLRVAAERSQLWSVVWNLASNAVEAMPDGGQLRLSARPAGDGVLLEVSDSGPGMDEATQARIFDPYFSTKDTGSGVGLGVVKRTVDALGGRIELQSSPGTGTHFRVVLPAASGERTASPVARHTAKRSSGVYVTEPLSAQILVVDDDEGLREFATATLQLRGATVVTAETLSDALAAPGRFDLALVDLQLTGERGDQVTAALRHAGRVGPVILMTGTDHLPDDMLPDGRPDALLRKPFEIDSLLECVVELLKQRTESTASA